MRTINYCVQTIPLRPDTVVPYERYHRLERIALLDLK